MNLGSPQPQDVEITWAPSQNGQNHLSGCPLMMLNVNMAEGLLCSSLGMALSCFNLKVFGVKSNYFYCDFYLFTPPSHLYLFDKFLWFIYWSSIKRLLIAFWYFWLWISLSSHWVGCSFCCLIFDVVDIFGLLILC